MRQKELLLAAYPFQTFGSCLCTPHKKSFDCCLLTVNSKSKRCEAQTLQISVLYLLVEYCTRNVLVTSRC